MLQNSVKSYKEPYFVSWLKTSPMWFSQTLIFSKTLSPSHL